jgi:hypothetical protein
MPFLFDTRRARSCEVPGRAALARTRSVRAEHSFNPTRLCKSYTPKLSVRQSKTEHEHPRCDAFADLVCEDRILIMGTAVPGAALCAKGSSRWLRRRLKPAASRLADPNCPSLGQFCHFRCE